MHPEDVIFFKSFLHIIIQLHYVGEMREEGRGAAAAPRCSDCSAIPGYLATPPPAFIFS